MDTQTFWNHHNQCDSSFHVHCLSSWFWRGCGDQCLGSQKKVIHRNPLLVRGIHVSCATRCLPDGLCVHHLKHPTFLLLCFLQDGSRGSGSGEEGRVQPPVRHLGSGHYRHWTGRASAAHVWPPPNEVRQRIWPWMLTTERSGWWRFHTVFQSTDADVQEQLPSSKAEGQIQVVTSSHLHLLYTSNALPVRQNGQFLIRYLLTFFTGLHASKLLWKWLLRKTPEKGLQPRHSCRLAVKHLFIVHRE